MLRLICFRNTYGVDIYLNPDYIVTVRPTVNSTKANQPDYAKKCCTGVLVVDGTDYELDVEIKIFMKSIQADV